MPDHVTANKVLQHLFIKYVSYVYDIHDMKFWLGIWKEDAILWKTSLGFI